MAAPPLINPPLAEAGLSIELPMQSQNNSLGSHSSTPPRIRRPRLNAFPSPFPMSPRLPPVDALHTANTDGHSLPAPHISQSTLPATHISQSPPAAVISNLLEHSTPAAANSDTLPSVFGIPTPLTDTTAIPAVPDTLLHTGSVPPTSSAPGRRSARTTRPSTRAEDANKIGDDARTITSKRKRKGVTAGSTAHAVAAKNLVLLEDCRERHCVLDVGQTINQNERFIEAMSDRNRRMQIYNQPLARRHFCAKCTRVYNHGDIANKLVSVIVVDGVVVSRPCCSVPNCWVHLRTPQDRFCHAHSAHLNQCAIKGCAQSVVSGGLTCDIPAHQESEALHTLRGKSRFRLHERLERSRAIHGRLANVQAGADDDGDGDGDGTQAIGEEEYDVKSGKKKKLRAQFTRNYTHCEELIVAPCRMIHARETMHNAEGVGSVAEFIRRVFRDPETRPTHVFFDNNCRLALHVQNDPFFQDIGLSVDVFHFECKHSKQDTFCQENCNPAAFPELKTDDGEWYFNSSACEQTNSWFGKFNPITRGMKPVTSIDMVYHMSCMRLHNRDVGLWGAELRGVASQASRDGDGVGGATRRQQRCRVMREN
ncbi:hypothetical protein DEU56DRAFT_907395 [Suillus clintonianus]|uniref:uncharacterized protein n=1 Tax=Suillus clintonianus TaxID=1904413 RepID=UPI001B862D41|nr:uncharacterized protein DEU56DRAFT_907395 [Suillus clintonianus]KAG2153928.1 hypothetical protein DEU56DRAFT_907395 [Suillus clintonianus]